MAQQQPIQHCIKSTSSRTKQNPKKRETGEVEGPSLCVANHLLDLIVKPVDSASRAHIWELGGDCGCVDEINHLHFAVSVSGSFARERVFGVRGLLY